MGSAGHSLVVYGHSRRADEALRELVDASRGSGRRLTVLALAPQEGKPGCCDTRSVLWNEVCRDAARAELVHAALAADDDEAVELDVLEYSAGHPADAVADEALARAADEIVLVDPRAVGLSRRERRRLRRRSPVPVAEGAPRASAPAGIRA